MVASHKSGKLLWSVPLQETPSTSHKTNSVVERQSDIVLFLCGFLDCNDRKSLKLLKLVFYTPMRRTDMII